jgi:hypothetical protein
MGGAVWWALLAAAPPACFYKLKQRPRAANGLRADGRRPTALFSGLLWHIGFRLGPAWAWAVRSGQAAQRGSFGCLSTHVMCALVGRRSVPESDAACRVLRVYLKRIYLVHLKV